MHAPPSSPRRGNRAHVQPIAFIECRGIYGQGVTLRGLLCSGTGRCLQNARAIYGPADVRGGGWMAGGAGRKPLRPYIFRT